MVIYLSFAPGACDRDPLDLPRRVSYAATNPAVEGEQGSLRTQSSHQFVPGYLSFITHPSQLYCNKEWRGFPFAFSMSKGKLMYSNAPKLPLSRTGPQLYQSWHFHVCLIFDTARMSIGCPVFLLAAMVSRIPGYRQAPGSATKIRCRVSFCA